MAEYNDTKLVNREPSEAELRAQIAATQASLRVRLNTLTDEVRSEVHRVSHSVEDSVLRVTQQVEASVSRVADRVVDGVTSVTDNIQQGVHQVATRVDGTVAGFTDAVNVRERVRQAPVAAVGLSVAAGFVGMSLLGGRAPKPAATSGFLGRKEPPASAHKPQPQNHAVVPALLLSAAGTVLRPMLIAAGRRYIANFIDRRQAGSDPAGFDGARGSSHRDSAPPFQL